MENDDSMQFFEDVGPLCASGSISIPITWESNPFVPEIAKGPVGREVILNIDGRKFRARIANVGPLVDGPEPEGSSMDVSFDSLEEIL